MSKPIKMYAITECKIHGKQDKSYAGTMVKVNNIPFTKKEKRGGCPICKKDTLATQ